MLYDVIEDIGIVKEVFIVQFGEMVLELVDGVSKLIQMNFEIKVEVQVENFQKMVMVMVCDICVILVKLVDCLYNMCIFEVLFGEKCWCIVKEILEIYVFIVNCLGMYIMCVEFEDLGFKVMYLMCVECICQVVKKVCGNCCEIVGKIQELLVNCFVWEGMEGQVIGCEKYFYSIYQKMCGKCKVFNEIMDVYVFCIIVDKVDICYCVLGVVYSLYKLFFGCFKDYIVIFKVNGYQLLYIILFGMYGVFIEIQICICEMEEMVNYGIVVYWLYKFNDEMFKGIYVCVW